MPPLAAVPDLERELDDLYGKPLDEFTKARNDLATRLRKAHQAEAAAEIRGLKKPSLVAWTANMLARSRPDLVSELLAAGEHLRTAQQRALGGTEAVGDLPAAFARERDAVRSLVTVARSELGTRATPTTLDRLGQTLRAAAVETATASTLAAGRLTEELQAVGFGSLEAVDTPRVSKPDRKRREAREKLTELRAEARRRAADARAAERAADHAEAEATRLRADAVAIADAAARAAAELAAAEQAVPGNR